MNISPRLQAPQTRVSVTAAPVQVTSKYSLEFMVVPFTCGEPSRWSLPVAIVKVSPVVGMKLLINLIVRVPSGLTPWETASYRITKRVKGNT
jgi:hypothetical protein